MRSTCGAVDRDNGSLPLSLVERHPGMGDTWVKRIVTDVLAALGYDNEAEIQKRGVLVAQGQASGAVDEEAGQEDYGGGETGSQVLTKAQRKQRNLLQGGQGSGKGQERQDPGVRVEEIVDENKEVTQRLKAGTIKEEPIVVESDDEAQEVVRESASTILERMEDVLAKVGRYQERLRVMCEEAREWEMNLPKVRDQPSIAMVDTGAEMNIIRERDAAMLGLEVEHSDHGVLHDANCKAIFCGTSSNVMVEIGRVRVRTCFFVMPDVDHPILLGRSFLYRTETLVFNRHEGTMILALSDPACGNYEIIKCGNTGPGSARNKLNLGSFTFEESEYARRRLREEQEEDGVGEVLSLSLNDVNKAMEVVAAHDMADPEAIKALREQVLGLLEQYNLTASDPKSKHCMREATILGSVYKEKGRRPDVKKTDKILEWPVPFQSITDVRSFLGTCGFWRSFVKDFATKTRHLRKIVHQDQEWVWGDDQEEAVERMKGEFKEGGLVLGAPNYEATEERPFVVETDAEPTALGGVLIQTDADGKERPLRSDFSKAVMQRGGRDTRPRQGPQGAAGRGEQHEPPRREPTPEFNDDNIEFFLDVYRDHAAQRGGSKAERIDHLRGIGRFEEPRLRASSRGRDGMPIRLEKGNVEKFIPAYEHYMLSQEPLDPGTETGMRDREEPQDPDMAAEQPDRVQPQGGEVITVGDDTPPCFPVLEPVQHPWPEGILEPGNEEIPESPPEAAAMPEQGAEAEGQGAHERARVEAPLDLPSATHVTKSPVIKEPLPAELPPAVPCTSEGMGAEALTPEGQGPRVRRTPRETREEKSARVRVRLDEIHARQAEMEATGIEPTSSVEPKTSEQRINELWASNELRVRELKVEHLTTQLAEERARSQAKEVEWERRFGEMTTAVDRLSAAWEASQAGRAGTDSQGRGMQASPSQGVAVEAPRQAEPMEEVSLDAVEEEGGAQESLMALSTERRGSRLHELAAAMGIGTPQERPQRLGAPELAPRLGELRAELGSWATETDSGGPDSRQEQQQEVMSEPTAMGGSQPSGAYGDEVVVTEGPHEEGPQKLDMPDCRLVSTTARGGEGAEAMEPGPQGHMGLSSCHEVTTENTGTPSASSSQGRKKKTARWHDTSCFWCKEEGQRAVDCPELLEDKAEGRVAEFNGKFYDRQGRIVERAPDGGRAQLYMQNQEELCK
ncbi:hypothetical protein CBR_g3929 [Chara braunii]|uniref:CCHC-type domain-containing protein n=1 Tax=Chara braunii TaxID=69332 RepID=A0A388KGN9_CHABU|nr:hypothetical protein CBR_g3929 [Chara braunii]|eukprot:GBG69230.1 hypothetical protein CBR_g3929 [Chara braunii]